MRTKPAPCQGFTDHQVCSVGNFLCICDTFSFVSYRLPITWSQTLLSLRFLPNQLWDQPGPMFQTPDCLYKRTLHPRLAAQMWKELPRQSSLPDRLGHVIIKKKPSFLTFRCHTSSLPYPPCLTFSLALIHFIQC